MDKLWVGGLTFFFFFTVGLGWGLREVVKVRVLRRLERRRKFLLVDIVYVYSQALDVLLGQHVLLRCSPLPLLRAFRTYDGGLLIEKNGFYRKTKLTLVTLFGHVEWKFLNSALVG